MSKFTRTDELHDALLRLGGVYAYVVFGFGGLALLNELAHGAGTSANVGAFHKLGFCAVASAGVLVYWCDCNMRRLGRKRGSVPA